MALDTFKKVLSYVKEYLGEGSTYGDQLFNFIKKLPEKYKPKNFIGVFPQDFKLPPLNYNCSYILNKAVSGESGEHWVACWQENGSIYCFDSFGRAIDRIMPIFDSNAGGGVIYNDNQVQKDSQEDCGQRSISFLICAKILPRGIRDAILI